MTDAEQNATPRSEPPAAPISRRWTWGLLALILLADIALRVHLLAVPLERDEGEYAYAGQLILHGILPYTKIYNMKMPGIYGAYALILAVFGQTPTGIHLGLMVANLATVIFVFLLGRKLLDRTTGLIAAASYVVLSVSQSVQGVFANAEQFVNLAAVAGLFILVKAADARRRRLFFLSGLLLGLAFMLKQHGGAFIAFAFVYLAYLGYQVRGLQPPNLRPFLLNVLTFAIGAVLPFVLTCLLFLACGVFHKFWFWTFTYAREYASLLSLADGWQLFLVNFCPILFSAPVLWGLGMWGAAALFLDRRARQRSFFLAGLAIFSVLAIVPGFYFRSHYFVLGLPALALLIGVGISVIGRQLSGPGQMLGKVIWVALVSVGLLLPVYWQRAFLFSAPPPLASSLTYGADHFYQSFKIGQYLQKRTSSADTIAVIGSEPEIYFYAKRLAATGYIYTYPLMEPQPYAREMQEEMIREIEDSKPAYLVLVDIRTSWLIRPESVRLIVDWFRRYSDKYFDRVAVFDTVPLNKTNGLWTGALEKSPRIYVYKRKPR